MKPNLFLFLMIALLSFTCSTKETEKIDVMRLHDIWALESIKGDRVIIDENIKSLPMIEIYVKEKRVHGNTSCNTIDGKVEIDNNHIIFFEIITTEMACPGDLEQKFLSALKEVNNYNIKKMKLYLYEDDEVMMIFQKID